MYNTELFVLQLYRYLLAARSSLCASHGHLSHQMKGSAAFREQLLRQADVLKCNATMPIIPQAINTPHLPLYAFHVNPSYAVQGSSFLLSTRPHIYIYICIYIEQFFGQKCCMSRKPEAAMCVSSVAVQLVGMLGGHTMGVA